jgi:hypothetical protein
MVQDVFIVDVLCSVVNAMQVPVFPTTKPTTYYKINFEPGSNTQIIDALNLKNGTALDKLKYPLIAAVMPISESTVSATNNLEVTFPRIVIAYLTKSATNSELVKDKYSSDGIFKTILQPCLREFIKQLAFSTYTDIGDPDMYEFTSRHLPSQQSIGQGLSDFVDIIEILNLKATIFPQIKTC